MQTPEIAADHGPHREGEVERLHLIGDKTTVAQHNDSIGEPADVAKAVGNVKHANATAAQPIHDRKESIRLCSRQARGRLVKDERRSVGGDRARDCDELTMRWAESAKVLIQRNVEPDPIGDRSRSRGDPAPGDHHLSATVAELVEQQVLANRQSGNAELVGRLMDDGDSGFPRVMGRRRVDLATRDKDASNIGLNDAGGYPGKGRLARAIRAHQRDNFPPAYREIDGLKRLRGAELLRYREKR